VSGAKYSPGSTADGKVSYIPKFPSPYRGLQVEEDEVGGTCGTNGREEERVEVIGRKARGKETTRKTET
jgi:hypothetical protein